MGFEEISDMLMGNHIPEAVLAVGGILAVLMTIVYLKDKRSAVYKLLMIAAMIFGLFMAIIAYNTYGTAGWALPTCVIMMIASFTLIIRPFKEVHFAVLIALLVMGIVYILLGGLAGSEYEILRKLSEGWFRIGIAVFCGVIVYSLLHMVESIVKIIGKILNAWPVLFVLGVICIVEAVMIFTDNGSIYDFIRSYIDK